MMINLSQTHPNVVLGDVPYHVILSKAQRSVIGFSDAVVDRRRGVKVLEEVIGDRHARLHRTHYLAEGLGCRVHLGADQQRRFGAELHLVNQIGYRNEAFVDHQVRIFGILNKPFVRVGIGAEDELQPVPFKAVAY